MLCFTDHTQLQAIILQLSKRDKNNRKTGGKTLKRPPMCKPHHQQYPGQGLSLARPEKTPPCSEHMMALSSWHVPVRPSPGSGLHIKLRTVRTTWKNEWIAAVASLRILRRAPSALLLHRKCGNCRTYSSGCLSFILKGNDYKQQAKKHKTMRIWSQYIFIAMHRIAISAF